MIVFAIGCILSLMGIQYVFYQKARNLVEQQFQNAIYAGLQDVGRELSAYNTSLRGHVPGELNTSQVFVYKLDHHLYLVDVNDYINPALLAPYLKAEFRELQLNIDFVYAFYDCERDEIVKSPILSVNNTERPSDKLNITFEHHEKYTYYFQVYFPDRALYLTNSMRLWIIFTILLLFVNIIFIYLLHVISKQHRLTETQKHFINNITHEFKTPLASISMAAESLQYMDVKRDEQRIKNYSELIFAQTRKLTFQIDRILRLLVAPKKSTALKLEKVNAAEFVEKHLNQVSFERSAEYICFSSDDDDMWVEADVLHFGNVITNLISNALKYSAPNTKVLIHLRREKNNCVLSVQDFGIGMEKKYKKKIFKRFFRIDAGDVHNVKGFGLGLSYVKHFVDLHKWKISVKSELGKGSIFTIQIPCK